MAASAKVIIITGHPATGKTTLAHRLASELNLPLLWKDQIKESLSETLGSGTDEWSRQLSKATWSLLYQQIEMLLKANVSFVVEGNFDPQYANSQWQVLANKYQFRPVQILCEADPDVLLTRYAGRIQSAERHIGHVDESENPAFLASIRRPFGWLEIEGQRITIDTTDFTTIDIQQITKTITMTNV